MPTRSLRIAAAFALFLITTTARAADPDDRFIAGYATALLEYQFHLPASTITVNQGVVRIVSKDIGLPVRERLTTAFKQIPGVARVEIVEATPPPVPALPDQPAPNPTGPGVAAKVQSKPWALFAPDSTFDPLIADPRWPNFSVSYDGYVGKHPPLRDVGSVSFGESISLYQSAAGPGGQFELGIQAAVFAIFNLNGESSDLVNADYFAGPILEYRKGDFSGFLRVYHQSSHLGDEFLLTNPGVTRVNLSYEEVDAVLSYDFFDKKLRVYGGGGYLFDRDPSSLKPGAVQYGLEYHGARIFPSQGISPVAAVDFQNREQHKWNLDFSARVGLQFEDPAKYSRRLQLLVEYYNGHSPNGQFLDQPIQYLGLGLHFYP